MLVNNISRIPLLTKNGTTRGNNQYAVDVLVEPGRLETTTDQRRLLELLPVKRAANGRQVIRVFGFPDFREGVQIGIYPPSAAAAGGASRGAGQLQQQPLAVLRLGRHDEYPYAITLVYNRQRELTEQVKQQLDKRIPPYVLMAKAEELQAAMQQQQQQQAGHVQGQHPARHPLQLSSSDRLYTEFLSALRSCSNSFLPEVLDPDNWEVCETIGDGPKLAYHGPVSPRRSNGGGPGDNGTSGRVPYVFSNLKGAVTFLSTGPKINMNSKARKALLKKVTCRFCLPRRPQSRGLRKERM